MQKIKGVSAVLVTRGTGVEHGVIEHLRANFHDVVVWNNRAAVLDLRVFGRYVAVAQARCPWVYVQDDDVRLSPAALRVMCSYQLTGRVTCNMPVGRRGEYMDGTALVGYGAIFQARVVRPAFENFLRRQPVDELFLRECDRVFTAFSDLHLVDVPFESLTHATAPGVMHLEPGHAMHRRQIMRRVLEVATGLTANGG